MNDIREFEDLAEAFKKSLDDALKAARGKGSGRIAIRQARENLEQFIQQTARLPGLWDHDIALFKRLEEFAAVLRTAMEGQGRLEGSAAVWKAIYNGATVGNRKGKNTTLREETHLETAGERAHFPKTTTSWDARCASFVAHVFPKEDREAWLGDLHEARHDLITSGYHPRLVPFITFGRIILLGWAALRIKYEDLVSLKRKQTEQK